MSWLALASCRDMDPSLFFPVGSGDHAYDDAREVCARCPVRDRCLEEALIEEGGAGPAYRYGMRGAHTPEERIRIRWRRSRRRSRGAA